MNLLLCVLAAYTMYVYMVVSLKLFGDECDVFRFHFVCDSRGRSRAPLVASCSTGGALLVPFLLSCIDVQWKSNIKHRWCLEPLGLLHEWAGGGSAVRRHLLWVAIEHLG